MDQSYVSLNQERDSDLVEIIDATPISVGPPLNNGNYSQNQENIRPDVSKLCALPMHERQKGWIQQRRPRPSGERSDKFYYHLESQRVCRTHLEVYDFITTGVLTRRPAEVVKAGLEARQGYSLAKKDVKALVQPKVVGSYNIKSKDVTRTTTTQMVEAFLRESYENLLNSGVRRRKREGDEVPGNEEDEDLSVIPLYDFELMNIV